MSHLFNRTRSSSDEERIGRRMSADIEAQLKRDKKQLRREVKLLILGTEKSGKSTFVKQMRLIHGEGYDELERCSSIPQIQSHTLLAANSLIDTMKKLAFFFADEDNVRNSELISSQDTSVISRLSERVLGAMNCIWKDKNVQFVYSRLTDCDLLDSVKYFLDSLDRISSFDYIPCDEDMLRIRTPTNGVEESFFKSKSMTFRMIEVGGLRGERRKWIHCFDSVSSIIFLASLNEYDQLLDGDLESNSGSSMSSISTRSWRDRSTKMDESLALFSTIMSHTGFSRTSFILLLNKVDLFEQKIANSNLSTYYPEYTGPELDANSAAKFIRDLYVMRSRTSAPMMDHHDCEQRPSRLQSFDEGNSSDTDIICSSSSSCSADSRTSCYHPHGGDIYIHFTSAFDTENMKLVFPCVKDTILRQNIEGYSL